MTQTKSSGSAKWYVGSILLHVIALGGLLAWQSMAPETPATEKAQASSKSTLNEEQVKKVTEHVQKNRKERFQQTLENMIEKRDRMQERLAEKGVDLEKMRREQLPHALDDSKQALEQAKTAQQKAMQAQARVEAFQQKEKQAMDKLLQSSKRQELHQSRHEYEQARRETLAAQQEARRAQEEAAQEQHKILKAQKRSLNKLAFLKQDEVREAKEQVREATEKQRDAENKQEAAIEATRDKMDPLFKQMDEAIRLVEKHQRNYDRKSQEVKQYESRVQNEVKKQGWEKEQRELAEQKVAEANKLLEQHTSQFDKAVETRKQLEAKLAEAEKHYQEAEKQYKAAEQTLHKTDRKDQPAHQQATQDRNDKRVARDQARHARDQAKNLLRQAQGDEQNKKRQRDHFTRHEKHELGKLERERKEEKRAEERVAAEHQKLHERQSQQQQIKSELDQALARLAELQQQAAMAQTGAHDLQQQANHKQQEATQAQGEALATLASLKDFDPLAEASEGESKNNAQQAQQVHAEAVPNMNLAQMYNAAVEVESDITEAFRHLKASEVALLQGIPLERALEIVDVQQAVRPLLDSDMLDAKLSSSAEARASNEQAQMVEMEMSSILTAVSRMNESVNRVRAAGGSLTDTHPDFTEAQSIEGDYVRKIEDGVTRPPAVSTEIIENSSSADRKIFLDQIPSDWLYIDSWYIIGPFDNSGRRNRDKAFPPESVVDLDATYLGKHGKVAWEFQQSGTLMVEPPHPTHESVYYAYTEIWIDQPADLYVSVGADDALKLWVNGEEVYKSGDRLKAWMAAEAVEPVHFRKGHNTVLYRVENGPGHVAFSMALQLAQQ